MVDKHDELAPELRSLVDAARGGLGPDAEAAARVAARLHASLGISESGPAGAGAGAAEGVRTSGGRLANTAIGLRLVVGLAFTAAIGWGTWRIAHGSNGSRALTGHNPVSTAHDVPLVRHVDPVRADAPSVMRSALPAATLANDIAPAVVASPSEPGTPTTRVTSAKRRQSTSDAAKPSTGAVAPATATTDPSRPPASIDASRLREEAALLGHARVAIAKAEAQRALTALQRYEAEFANGILRREATILTRRLCDATQTLTDAGVLWCGQTSLGSDAQ